MTFAEGLRALADWYEQHPDVEHPGELSVYGAADTRERAAEIARMFGRATKSFTGVGDELMELRHDFGGGVALRFVFNRDAVCSRRVVGTRTVPERVIPAHTEEMVEWDCEPILGGTP